jgi:hypothetical protein
MLVACPGAGLPEYHIYTGVRHPTKTLCISYLQVKLFHLQQVYEPWMDASAPVRALQPLSYGLILATFTDSSIQLVRGARVKPRAVQLGVLTSAC